MVQTDADHITSYSSFRVVSVPIKNGTERRQFNRPICPKEGRGEYAFFKRVPSAKPIFKCPQCKTAKRGGGGGSNACMRLHPIPKGGGEGIR